MGNASTDLEVWWINATKKFPARKTEGVGHVRTCPVRLSYPSLFEKRAPKSGKGKAKYQASLLFPKGCDMSVIEAAIQEAGEARFGKDWIADQKRPAKQRVFKWPLQDQGTQTSAGYVDGAWYVVAKSDDKPVTVDAGRQFITDPAGLYPGCFVLATLHFYGFDAGESKGVFVGLDGVQFFAPGPKFGHAAKPVDQQFDELGPIEAPAFEGDDALL